jgi:cobalt-precorrin 5A hydrolase
MIVAGVGCRKGASAEAIAAAINDSLARAGILPDRLSAIATITAKRGESGLAEAADMMGVPLIVVEQLALAAAGPRTVTHSQHALAFAGVPSVAEAAALAAAGPGARLLVPRIVVGAVTCALAQDGDLP